MMSATSNNEKLNKKMSVLYVATRIMLLGLATTIWAGAPVLFFGWPPKKEVFDLLILLYIVILWAICSVLDCFAIGHARIREVVAWFSLALLFADLLLWVVKLLVVIPATGILFVFCVWLVQSMVGMLAMFVLTKINFKLYPVRHICAIISGKEHEKRSLAKIARYPERFSIDMVLDKDDVDWDDLEHLAPDCNTIYIGDIELSRKQDLIENNFQKSRMLAFLPSPADILYSGVRPIQIFDALLFFNTNIGLTPEQRFAKRIMDILGALVGIALSLIPMAVCAVAIKTTDGGTVFYKQKRLTRDGKEFELIKLRSMCMDAEKEGVQFSSAKDTRVTPIGKIMRLCRLDEVPQFFNVLSGSISLVGPRAERPEIASLYTESHPAFEYRLKVKAGLTGYAQINGRYNTELEDKLHMDLYYIEHWSLIGDIALMLETFKILLSPDSTSGYDEGHIDKLYNRG